MDVINNFISENKDILSILITLLVGFIAWICKELIKTPMRQSRETFFKVTEKRIGILSELYNYINIIALFPQETNIKEELQKIILLQSPNQKIPDRKTKCVIKTHINIKQNVIFGAKLKPV